MTVPVGHAIEFRIPRPVASSKNRRRVFARGKRVISLPSAQAVADSSLIATLARAAAGGVMFGPDDALLLTYEHDIETDEVLVRVEKVGSIPTKGKRGTKRDVHGMFETIADALQGVLYDDDRAIDEFGGRRIR